MTNSQQKGFTLIELTGVMAISGIVAAANIPTYQDYIKMSKVSEANTLFADFKTQLMNMYSDKGTWPTFVELKDLGVIYRGVYTTANYSDGMATAGTPQVCFMVLGFDMGKDSIGWKYIQDPVNPKQQIWNCKASFSGCTTIEDKYLPKTCQSTSPD
jgi:type IV pilus assembly protein PilA